MNTKRKWLTAGVGAGALVLATLDRVTATLPAQGSHRRRHLGDDHPDHQPGRRERQRRRRDRRRRTAK